jgi:hypothetical protein
MSTLDRFRRLTLEDKDRIREEIVANCDLVGDCWVWKGAKSSGYGMKYIQGKMQTVSRFMLCYSTRESLNIDSDACHVPDCPYKACCNPRHLFWGTHQENVDQRERDRHEAREIYDVLPPVPLGQETHETYSVRTEIRALCPRPLGETGRAEQAEQCRWEGDAEAVQGRGLHDNAVYTDPSNQV